jgi:predicted dehydrogenase
VLTLGGEPEAWQGPDLWRLLANLAHVRRHGVDEADVRVGMLGFGAIGREHATAVAAVPGLRLVAVSDLSPARLDDARQAVPGVRTSSDPEALLAADDVDLVVVSTPPDTHAAWARRLLSAGRHVVLEKPMALSVADCDDVLALAQDRGRLAVVYQNRRFDPDYLALARVVRSGRIGEVFHLESFVGGYGHPCSYWHSDAAVSGGALYDWGSHHLDQVLDLVPGPLRHVTASEHKRRWFDVTNADHSRVTLTYEDGREAEFVHSDLAAAAKPKWYVLGTRGAVVGHWRTERVLARTSIGTLDEDVLAPADSPATLSVHDADGSVTALAVPAAPRQPFHRELADHLLRGLPMTVRAEQSRRVVAVLEAAARSAQRDGSPVPVS